MKMDVEGSEWDSLLKSPSVNARGPSPLDAPNIPALADCQESPSGAELTRIGRWTRRMLRARYADWYNDWKDRLLPPY